MIKKRIKKWITTIKAVCFQCLSFFSITIWQATKAYSTKSSSQLNIKKPVTLHPQQVTGFCDAEASFGLELVQKPTLRAGWQILPVFKILLHKKDLPLLQEIQKYLHTLGKELGQQCSGHSFG